MSDDNVRIRLYRLIGTAIRDVRRAASKRVTQQDLADRTGGAIRRSTLANIEVGKQQISIYQLYVVAQALGVQPHALLPTSSDAFGDEGDVLRMIEKNMSPGAKRWADRVMTKATQSVARKEKPRAE